MPLEIRPSDVMQAAADALSNAAKGVDYIHQKSYEAQRVAQVNEGLTYLEKAYQDYNDSLSHRVFEQTIDPVTGGKGTVTKKQTLGETDEGTILQDHGKFTQAAIDYITKNFSNSDAQKELLQHLAMKSIQNQGVVKQQWQVAAEHNYLASLDTLTQTVLQSNDPWEVKIAKIKSRVDEGVTAGRLWDDEAQKYLGTITAQAQKSDAFNGALNAMRIMGNPGAGEEWLDKNTSYWNANPDARNAMKVEVRNEYSYQVRTNDEAADKEMWGKFDTAGGDPRVLLQQLTDPPNRLPPPYDQRDVWIMGEPVAQHDGQLRARAPKNLIPPRRTSTRCATFFPTTGSIPRSRKNRRPSRGSAAPWTARAGTSSIPRIYSTTPGRSQTTTVSIHSSPRNSP